MGDQNIRVSTQWEHSITNLLGHAPTTEPGIALRQWVHYQGVENILDLLSWEEDELKAIPAQQVFTLDDHGQGSYVRTNQIKQICGLITHMKHVFREYMSEEDRQTHSTPSHLKSGINTLQPCLGHFWSKIYQIPLGLNQPFLGLYLHPDL